MSVVAQGYQLARVPGEAEVTEEVSSGTASRNEPVIAIPVDGRLRLFAVPVPSGSADTPRGPRMRMTLSRPGACIFISHARTASVLPHAVGQRGFWAEVIHVHS